MKTLVWWDAVKRDGFREHFYLFPATFASVFLVIAPDFR